jgi:DNA-binding MarR family transcriptional regulator
VHNVDKPLDLLEFETMLFGRYSLASRGRVGRLDRSAYTLLSRLQMQGPMSIGELSDALGLDASTLNRQTAAMMRSGLAERIPDPDGGIARKFRVTADGEGSLREERAAAIGHLDEILAEWSPAQVAALVEHLERFNSAIERYHGRPWPRPSGTPRRLSLE